MKAILNICIFFVSSYLIGQQYPEFILVEGGYFRMGRVANDYTRNAGKDEYPAHFVTLDSFYMSKTEVTAEQYQLFCKETNHPMPTWQDVTWEDKHPISMVSWNDAMKYCQWLGEKLNKTVRLPYEAEWEFAASGGNKTQDFKFAGSDRPFDVGWMEWNSGGKLHTVGEKKANELGFVDMIGNVSELCMDWYASGYYDISPSKNPKGPVTGVKRVRRGGSIYEPSYSSYIRSRSACSPDPESYKIGFRVVHEL